METIKPKSDKDIFLDKLQEQWDAECVKQNFDNENYVLYGLWLQEKLQKSEERVRELEAILAEKVRVDRLFLQKEDSIISRHNAMIAELRETQNIPMSLNSGYVKWSDLQSIITKYDTK